VHTTTASALFTDGRNIGVSDHAQRQRLAVGSAGEVDDGDEIWVWNIDSRRPFRNQHGGPDVLVVVAQETVLHIELLDGLREYLFADLSRGGSRGLR
jgi:hypothetical protein